MTASPGDHRAGPRRRGEALVTAILTATIDELRESGYRGLTMDAVARRAGASKASLYRRWDSRAALVIDAVHRIAPLPEQIPDTGTLRGDMLEVLSRTAAALDGVAGDALRGLIAEALPRAEGIRDIRARSQGRNVRLMAEVLRRAVARGEITEAAIVPARLGVGSAVLRDHFLFGDRALDETLFVEIVDDILLPLFDPELLTRPDRSRTRTPPAAHGPAGRAL